MVRKAGLQPAEAEQDFMVLLSCLYFELKHNPDLTAHVKAHPLPLTVAARRPVVSRSVANQPTNKRARRPSSESTGGRPGRTPQTTTATTTR